MLLTSFNQTLNLSCPAKSSALNTYFHIPSEKKLLFFFHKQRVCSDAAARSRNSHKQHKTLAEGGMYFWAISIPPQGDASSNRNLSQSKWRRIMDPQAVAVDSQLCDIRV